MGLERETASRHTALTEDFLHLYQEFVSEGLFAPSPRHIIYRLSELVIFAALGVFLLGQEGWISRILGIICFALFQGRSGWLMHEGGHHSLTGNSKVDRFIQAVVYGINPYYPAKSYSVQAIHNIMLNLDFTVNSRTGRWNGFNMVV